MGNADRVIDLREDIDFIEQYIRLRNNYCDLLATDPVNAAGTAAWLDRSDVEIRGIVRDNRLVGISILYLERNGEIALFSEIKGSGLGGTLLSIIEKVARARSLQEVWAWVLIENAIAQRAFLKAGYRKEKKLEKLFHNETLEGVVFKKELSEDNISE